MTDKTELLRYIRALAEKGSLGEAENAKEIYERLLKKYNIDEYEIDDNKEYFCEFKYNGEYERTLLSQIIFMITGKCDVYTLRNRRNVYGAYCTTLIKAKIDYTFEFYNYHLKVQLNNFVQAFILKNSLFPEETQVEGGRTYTEEEREKILKYSRTIDMYHLREQIEAPK